jgi:hypothetical protein
MRQRLRGLRWALAGALVAGLVLASTGGATDGQPILAAATNTATNTTRLMCTSALLATCFHGESNNGTGLAGFSTGGGGTGVYGESSVGSGVWGKTTAAGNGVSAVRGEATATTGFSFGVIGINSSTTGGYGTYGESLGAGTGVGGLSATGNGVFGWHQGTTGDKAGVRGQTSSTASLASGVKGEATASPPGGDVVGVWGDAPSGIGMLASGPIGILGYSASAFAGYFVGNVHVNGTLTKGAGAFRIDHPLDPQHKYLQHSFVESPDMMNIYNGNVRTDRRGFATVRLPRYFRALNRSFRYQLTVLGRSFARAVVWQKITGDRFRIRTDRPGVEVSWQVTGIRKDAYANAHRIRPEIAKGAVRGATAVTPRLLRRLDAAG